MITAAEAKAELLRRRARVDLLAFLAYCWWMPTPLPTLAHELFHAVRHSARSFGFEQSEHDEAEAYLFERAFEYFAEKLDEDHRAMAGAEQDGKEGWK